MADLTQHPPADTLQRYRERTLSPLELLELDDHLADCVTCRERLSRGEDLTGAFHLFQPQSQPEHLSYEQLAAHVEGTLGPDELTTVRKHLADCPLCRTEDADLRVARAELEEAAAELVPQPRSARIMPSWMMWLALPTMGAAVLAAALNGSQAITLRNQLREAQASNQGLRDIERRAAELDARSRKLTEENRTLQTRVPALTREAEALRKEKDALQRRLNQTQVASAPRLFQDGTSRVLVDAQGHAVRIVRTEPLPQFASAALESGSVELPDELKGLIAPAPVTRGGGVRFRLLGPTATRVAATQPRFEWSAVPKATRYELVLTELAEGATPLEYEVGTATHWTPPTPLRPGARYGWEVRAYDGEELLGSAPQPPDAAARFEVLPAAQSAELERELAKYATSPLTRALLHARSGILQEAEQELQALAAANPGTPRVTALLETVRAARKPPASPAGTP